jgi:hypothetical protein
MSTYSPSLRIELITTGTQAGTWGNTTNTNLGGLIESAIAGYVSVSITSANQALTALNGAPDESRHMTLALTTTTGAAFSVYAPPAEKTYVIYNASAYAATIYNSTILGNTTAAGVGVTIPAGKTVTIWSDGTNFSFQNDHLSSLTLASPLAAASGGTGLTALGAGVATFLGTPSSANLAAAVTGETGSGALVFANSPTLVTPALGTPSSATLTNATGLPVSTGISGLGTGIATALAVNVGTAGAPVINGGVLGTPSSGTVTNLTGTASININGTVGATTANSGAFTTLSATGVTTVQAGSAGAPAITTSGDTNTGIFFPAADTIAFAEGGAEVARFNADAQFVAAAGTASLPVITTTGDVNTGIFFPAADTIAFSEGGVEAARFDASGNLGLGVTPSAWGLGKAIDINTGSALWGVGNDQTQVLTNTYFDGTNFRYKNNATASRYRMDGNSHQWYVAPSGTAGDAISFTQAMTLDASGNLLVNTTSQYGSQKLSVNGGIAIDGRSAATPGLSEKSDDDTGIFWPAADTLGFTTNGTERARIDSSGNLLVGTTGLTNNGILTVNGLARFFGTGDGSAFAIDKSTSTTTTSQVFAFFTVNNQTTGSGQINANGASQAAFGSFSDVRLKQNIVDLSPQLSNIMALRPVEFDYIESEGGGHQTGFVAQEIETVFSDAVGQRSDGMKTVTGWNKTEARLVKAIQEQQALIQTLTARVAALESN